jgi:hypothetical protein
MKNILILLFVAPVVFSCEYETISVHKEDVEEEINHSLAGSWLYVEYGYSPGGKYHVVPVPADPPKTITFSADLTMSSTDMGFGKFKYYRLLEDTLTNRQVIAFFEKDPGNGSLELAGLSPTFNTFWQGNHLTLNYRWCIEGCHMKFKRIASPESE